MTPLAWLAGFIMPACAFAGASGLPPPKLLDFAHFERQAASKSALAAPAGFAPTPNLVTPIYPVAAPQLYAAIRAVAERAARTYAAGEYPAALQMHWVVRSAVFNFPDLVTAQVAPRGPDASVLILYSRSVYGRSDLGVNRKRLAAWLEALDPLNASHSPRPER
jgi:uncharacterized protein (DUF1499 family)